MKLHIILLILLFIINPTYAAQLDVNGKVLGTNSTVYFAWDNPETATLQLGIWRTNGSLIFSTTTSTIKGLQSQVINRGTYIANISNGSILIDEERINTGTIMDSGFKDTMITEFEGNLAAVGTTILLGFGIGATSIGRFAGMPLFTAVLVILGTFGYIPSWPIYLILFLACALFSKILYDWLGAGG